MLVSLEGLRSAPAQCQKRLVVLRAQSFGRGICTAPQPWSMMAVTKQCGGQPCHQLLLVNMEDLKLKSNSRECKYAKWPRCETAFRFSQKISNPFKSSLATGLQSMAPASKAGSSMFLHVLRDKGSWVLLHGVGRFKSTHSIANRYHKGT